jgi:hypothetical protein
VMVAYRTVKLFDLADAPDHVREAIRPIASTRDCLTFGGQAAAAKVGWVSFAGENLCPKAEPKVPL